MRNLFIQTFQLNATIFTNTLIYRLRSLPLIKHVIPADLYGNEGIFAFVCIITALLKALGALSKKALYLVVMVVMPLLWFDGDRNTNLIVILTLLSIFGAFFNQKVFEATKEKYYAVVLMRIDANQYAYMSYLSESISFYVTLLIPLMIIALFMNLDLWICFFFPLLILALRIIIACLVIKIYSINKVLICYAYKTEIILSIVVVIIVLLTLQFEILIPPYLFIIITLFFIVASLILLPYFMKTKVFKAIYKQKLTLNNVIFNLKATIATNAKKTSSKQITFDSTMTSNKNGYDYFNELFIQRHRKILTHSIKRITLIFLGIIMIMITITLFLPIIKPELNHVIMSKLPSILMIMYFTNRGAIITRAMFINCDSSMLYYRFYRKPDVILSLFKERLKTLIVLNLIPSFALSIGILVLLFLSGGTSNPFNYLLIFLAVNLMSVFFSVHHLVLYYLLQPYNINMEAKGFLFNIISTITYIICYAFISTPVSTLPFTIIVTLFCILYIIISLYLAYKLAYKTFKIKQ